MHGGGAGAPSGNRNALKRGQTSRQSRDEQRALQALMRAARETLADFDSK